MVTLSRMVVKKCRRTNLDAGHTGAAGRFDRLREVALAYAFEGHVGLARERVLIAEFLAALDPAEKCRPAGHAGIATDAAFCHWEHAERTRHLNNRARLVAGLRVAGIDKDIADAIADGRRPTGMSTDEEIVYDFTTELQKNKRGSESTFNRAEQRFGKKGVVDMTGISGYYTFLAMKLNMARYEFSGAGPRLSRFPN
jgi:hypothetical protein